MLTLPQRYREMSLHCGHSMCIFLHLPSNSQQHDCALSGSLLVFYVAFARNSGGKRLWERVSGSVMLGPPSLQFSRPVLHDCKMAAAISGIVSMLMSGGREEEGALGCCVHLLWKSKAFPDSPETCLPLIGRHHHLTTCPLLAARKVAK
ncbi:PREDICTED: uncharacterized protein LOC105576832 [Cercocebus atys]|uniref:uncharacterized protein LOC105576832 n=1 Tax=Cercocebus atys TaxID=9531 RepID=UPI0005F54768|nr:PREDICTED: uncharacterized protein LOC105576832 [Cercocebus atys]